MQTRWGNPIQLRFHSEKDKKIRIAARKAGLTIGMYVRTIIYRELEREAA